MPSLSALEFPPSEYPLRVCRVSTLDYSLSVRPLSWRNMLAVSSLAGTSRREPDIEPAVTNLSTKDIATA